MTPVCSSPPVVLLCGVMSWWQQAGAAVVSRTGEKGVCGVSQSLGQIPAPVWGHSELPAGSSGPDPHLSWGVQGYDEALWVSPDGETRASQESWKEAPEIGKISHKKP